MNMNTPRVPCASTAFSRPFVFGDGLSLTIKVRTPESHVRWVLSLSWTYYSHDGNTSGPTPKLALNFPSDLCWLGWWKIPSLHLPYRTYFFTIKHQADIDIYLPIDTLAAWLGDDWNVYKKYQSRNGHVVVLLVVVGVVESSCEEGVDSK